MTDLAGIGLVLGKQLKRKGFKKAFVVFGKFLLLKKNKESFVNGSEKSPKQTSNRPEIDISVYMFGVRNFYNNCDIIACVIM